MTEKESVVRVLSEWGMRGIEMLQAQAAVLVLVDVLSFSTTVDVAVSRGAEIYPFPLGDKEAAEAAAGRVGLCWRSRAVQQEANTASRRSASRLPLPA